jgi:hypothetical protein
MDRNDDNENETLDQVNVDAMDHVLSLTTNLIRLNPDASVPIECDADISNEQVYDMLVQSYFQIPNS